MNIDSDFKNDRSRMKAFCTIHNVPYTNTVTNILYSGASCKLCANVTRADKMKEFNTMDQVIDRILELNPYLRDQDYSANLGKPYINTGQNLKVYCPVHDHTYSNSIMNIKNGAGCIHCNLSLSSKEELLIRDKIGIPFVLNNREILNGLEIDLFSEEYSFGIEYNGSAFHSVGINTWEPLNNIDRFNPLRHQFKTNLMESKGYQLFHINEMDWVQKHKQQIWLSLINNKLGKSVKRFARKLEIQEVLPEHREIINNFVDANHLQGRGKQWKYAFMLLENNIIHSVMTFGDTSGYDYELYRFCTRIGYNVVGGASRLLKAFERKYKPESLLTYAKRDWSQGNLYEKLNFTFIKNTEPSMFYVKGVRKFSRQKFQKHKLEELYRKGELDTLDGTTAKEIMMNNGYRIFYDSGNKKYVKIYKGE